jgi:hypothetical protein
MRVSQKISLLAALVYTLGPGRESVAFGQQVHDYRSKMPAQAPFTVQLSPIAHVPIEKLSSITFDTAGVDWVTSRQIVVTRRTPTQVIVRDGVGGNRTILGFSSGNPFERGVSATVRKNGRLVLIDGTQRVGEFTTRGDLVRQYQLRDTLPPSARTILGESGDGSLVALAPYSRKPFWEQAHANESLRQERPISFRDSLIIIFYDSTGGARKVLGPFLGMTRVVQVVRKPVQDGIHLIPQRLRPWREIRSSGAVVGGGILTVYLDAERELVRYDLHGALKCRALIDGESERGPAGAVPVNLVHHLGLLADDSGNVWFETTKDGGARPQWVVLSPQCDIIGQMSLPNGFRLLKVANGHLMGVSASGSLTHADTYKFDASR